MGGYYSTVKSFEALLSLESRIRRSRIVHRLVRALVQSVEFGFSILLFVARVRFLRLTAPGRIGHVVIDPMAFVKKRKLGMIGWYYPVLISPPGVTANECLLDYWTRYIRVVRSPLWARILTRLTRFKYLEYDATILALNQTAHSVAVERAWGTRASLFQLTRAHRERGRAWLRDLGVPPDGQIVCFHNREAGYAPDDDLINEYRNNNVDNYVFAARELAKRGYWCFRMGGPTQSRIASTERVIDYAHRGDRCDWLDVFLCAECRFFIGASSGLLYVANIFGRPLAAANQAPLSTVLAFGARDVAIPKLLWSEPEGRYLTFRQAFSSDVSNFRFADLFEKAGIRCVENTGEEILDLALEVLERSEGKASYTRDDEALQRRFTEMMRPGHYGYGGVNRVGRAFLRKYETLFG